MAATPQQAPDRSTEHVLAVIDWSVDPNAAVEAMRRRAGARHTVFNLLVPARLARLDWIGNPKASCPCATQQLEELLRLGAISGLDIDAAGVGDPERVPAVRTALDSWSADGVMLFERSRLGLFKRASVETRLRRSTGLAIETVESPLRHPFALQRKRFRNQPRCAVVTGR